MIKRQHGQVFSVLLLCSFLSMRVSSIARCGCNAAAHQYRRENTVYLSEKEQSVQHKLCDKKVTFCEQNRAEIDIAFLLRPGTIREQTEDMHAWKQAQLWFMHVCLARRVLYLEGRGCTLSLFSFDP